MELPQLVRGRQGLLQLKYVQRDIHQFVRGRRRHLELSQLTRGRWGLLELPQLVRSRRVLLFYGIKEQSTKSRIEAMKMESIYESASVQDNTAAIVLKIFDFFLLPVLVFRGFMARGPLPTSRSHTLV